MNCPRCGYARSAFDTYCLRCRLMAAEGRSARPVPPAEQTVVMSGPIFTPPPARRFSGAWVLALLAVLALLVGVILSYGTAAPHAPPAQARLAPSSQMRASS